MIITMTRFFSSLVLLPLFLVLLLLHIITVSAQTASPTNYDASRMVQFGGPVAPRGYFAIDAAVSNGVDKVAFTLFSLNAWDAGGYIAVLGFDKGMKSLVPIDNNRGTCAINIGGRPGPTHSLFATVPLDLGSSGTIYRVDSAFAIQTSVVLSAQYNFVRKTVSNYSMDYTFFLTDGNSSALGANRWNPVLILFSHSPNAVKSALNLSYPAAITGSTAVNSHVVFAPATDQILVIAQTMPPIISRITTSNFSLVATHTEAWDTLFSSAPLANLKPAAIALIASNSNANLPSESRIDFLLVAFETADSIVAKFEISLKAGGPALMKLSQILTIPASDPRIQAEPLPRMSFPGFAIAPTGLNYVIFDSNTRTTQNTVLFKIRVSGCDGVVGAEGMALVDVFNMSTYGGIAAGGTNLEGNLTMVSMISTFSGATNLLLPEMGWGNVTPIDCPITTTTTTGPPTTTTTTGTTSTTTATTTTATTSSTAPTTTTTPTTTTATQVSSSTTTTPTTTPSSSLPSPTSTTTSTTAFAPSSSSSSSAGVCTCCSQCPTSSTPLTTQFFSTTTTTLIDNSNSQNNNNNSAAACGTTDGSSSSSCCPAMIAFLILWIISMFVIAFLFYQLYNTRSRLSKYEDPDRNHKGMYDAFTLQPFFQPPPSTDDDKNVLNGAGVLGSSNEMSIATNANQQFKFNNSNGGNANHQVGNNNNNNNNPYAVPEESLREDYYHRDSPKQDSLLLGTASSLRPNALLSAGEQEEL